MRFVFWLVVLPLAVAMAMFAVNNRETVFVDFWPLPYAVEVPLFLLILGTVFLGLLIGGTATWLGQGRWRRLARGLQRRVKHLESEIEGFRARTAPQGAPPRVPLDGPRQTGASSQPGTG